MAMAASTEWPQDPSCLMASRLGDDSQIYVDDEDDSKFQKASEVKIHLDGDLDLSLPQTASGDEPTTAGEALVSFLTGWKPLKELVLWHEDYAHLPLGTLIQLVRQMDAPDLREIILMQDVSLFGSVEQMKSLATTIQQYLPNLVSLDF
ncbi:expressed unknown protein [Seminavis robusta]|uniref:Uncharacterized protein n=1 Tax=Seminavis robusta TaxID=568900 RepID=A0A9N8DTI9_9STRA|nr:expressed unknown protein [Seminavis robusta]|eukprot:Sro346_g122730.1 n/a (149) ;mRNA; f:45634-46080